MPDLSARLDLTQLRHQAKDLLRAAKNGDPTALARLRAVSNGLNLAVAQLAVAREYGFASWAKLKAEVWRDRPGTGAIARMLLQAGAPVDGAPDDSETPLITAASYGDAEVARVLIEAGANLDATASPTAGGVPGGTALRHAAVFGKTDVVDVLVAAGARIDHLSQAAAAGDVTGRLHPDSPQADRMRALVMAADHQRLDVIDQLLDAETPTDATDQWDRQPLQIAAVNGRVATVQHLIARGADPNHRDATHHRTALYWCRNHAGESPRHTEIEAILGPITKPSGAAR